MALNSLSRFSRNSNQRGFTLVELAIVLVIVGLLIGGLLGAKSLMKTAKIQKTVRELAQYEIALSNFSTRYSQLPGDSTLFTPAGNNDNRFLTNAEVGAFWSHLSQGVSLKNPSGIDYVAYDYGDASNGIITLTDTNCPTLSISQNLNPAHNICLWLLGSNNIFYEWEYYAMNAAADEANINPLTAIDTLALDKKIDDGHPSAGHFRAHNFGDLYNGDLACSNGTNYLVSDDRKQCGFSLAVGVMQGLKPY